MPTDTRAALEKATVRLEILQDRMRGCPAHEADSVHELSIFEIEGWIEEQRDLLALSAPEERGEPDGGIVYIARCPTHGLHGARTECFACGGPVEQVPMRYAGPATPAPVQEPEPMFMGIPESWWDAGLWRCENGHVSRMKLKSETLGCVCLSCGSPVRITHPDDTDDPEPPAPPVAQGAEPTLDDALHDLHDRLRDEGRDADADIIDRAAWALDSADLERADYPVPQGLPREEVRRELLCELCRKDYPVWFAPNPLWNAVMQEPDGTDRWSFVCPGCFITRAVMLGERGVFQVSIEGDAPVAGSEERT